MRCGWSGTKWVSMDGVGERMVSVGGELVGVVVEKSE